MQHFELNKEDIKEAELILYKAVEEHQNKYSLLLTPEM
jgi:hypothetical protein